MLRVAIVPPAPVPYREALFARLAAREDLAVRVIYQAGSQASWDQAKEWFPADHRYDAVHLRPRHIDRPGRSPITWPRGLERALHTFDPHVLVVSEFGPATLRALAFSRLRRRALVVLSEVTAAVERTLPPYQRLLHRALARQADGLIAVSSAAADRLAALGVERSRVAVSLQPVDEESLKAALAELPRPQCGPVEVLAVARLVPDKGLDVLLEAFAATGLGREEARLSVAGGGPLEAELRSLAHSLDVNVRFLGSVPPRDLPRLYAQAHLFVLPSRFEPFGAALREAVVAGLPVICTAAVGAAADLAHGGAGGANAIVVAPGDVGALAGALRELCRVRALRDRLGAQSKRIAAAHPLDRDVEAFASAISRAARAAHVRR